jgi:pimeloyl-ACP methyl ester carboxylesterase
MDGWVNVTGPKMTKGMLKARQCIRQRSLDKRSGFGRNVAMSFPAARAIAFVLVIGLLPACSTLPRTENDAAAQMTRSSLSNAGALLRRAARFGGRRDEEAVYRLRAAEIAWDELSKKKGVVKDMAELTPAQREAVRILALSAEGLAPLFVGKDAALDQTFAFGGRSYRVTAARDSQPTVFSPARIESVRPAREVRRRLTVHWHTEPGVGGPLSPKWYQPRTAGLDRFVPKRGYIEPLTAVLAFDAPAKAGAPRAATLTAYDPTAVKTVRLAGAQYPLAADFTAPIVDSTSDIREFWLALSGLFRPDSNDAFLAMLQPYDSRRVPVVLVHGLNSHPLMWRNVINDLRADPDLRSKVQFWVFMYPSGWPISYSASHLREELAALNGVIGRQQDMVLVGHSMGGLLSRMQVITPGRKIWDTMLDENADHLYASLRADHPLRRSLLFTANKEVGRVVFICVPHRGSSIADWSLVALINRLIHTPGRILNAVSDLPAAALEGRPLTSIAGLSPGNPLFGALENIPIEVPHHSIIGDRGRGNTPNSSDGVVHYRSSHLASADSELIVPGPHGSHDLPQTIKELERILELHIGAAGKTKSPKSKSPTTKKP